MLSKIALFPLIFFAFNAQTDDDVNFSPEQTIAIKNTKVARGNKYMVVTANEHASHAARDILRSGGNAVDAMIAAQLVLNLVEPQSSGLGGGGFVLYYDAATKKILSYDARETTPQNIDVNAFAKKDQSFSSFCEAVRDGNSIGVPGIPKLLYTMHEKHGHLSWHRLFSYAEAIATEGFSVSERLSKLLSLGCVKKELAPVKFKQYFFSDNEPIVSGTILKNQDFAKTLFLFKKYGDRVFYTGEIARDIVRNATKARSKIQLQDLEQYKIILRKPVCCNFNSYKICSQGPPSSGGITLCQILKIIDTLPLYLKSSADPASWHWFLEASKLAFADRAKYIADPNLVNVPITGLLLNDYINHRAEQINANIAATIPVAAGMPPGVATSLGSDLSHEYDATTHISIIDAAGNAVSFTSSIEHAFGSQVFTNGFLLNNQLTDFSAMKFQDNNLIANRVEPNKRPRSSMTPTLVFDKNDKLVLIIGSAGGVKIIPYVAKVLLSVLSWSNDIQAAINFSNITCINSAIKVEKNFPKQVLKNLEKLGHKFIEEDLNSGTQAIHITQYGIYGAADPRRESYALGD